jgi:hypothetical protein
MARIRSVKPEIRESAIVASWPFEVRYFWILLWGYLDDWGRGLDIPKRIAGDCFPLDDIDAGDINEWLDLMTRGLVTGVPGPICRYTVVGKRYVHAVSWGEHQKPNRPTPSRIPPCPIHESLNGDSVSESTDAQDEFRVGAGVVVAEELGAASSAPREPLNHKPTPAAERIVREATDATAVEAHAVVALVESERKPRNLNAFLRRLAADGDLKDYLDRVRGVASGIERTRALAAARDGPDCPHGVPGGEALHPDSGEPLCPNCRAAARRTPP